MPCRTQLNNLTKKIIRMKTTCQKVESYKTDNNYSEVLQKYYIHWKQHCASQKFHDQKWNLKWTKYLKNQGVFFDNSDNKPFRNIQKLVSNLSKPQTLGYATISAHKCNVVRSISMCMLTVWGISHFFYVISGL